MKSEIKWVKDSEGQYSNICNKCCAEQVAIKGEFFEENCSVCNFRCINFNEGELDCGNCKQDNLEDDSEI